MVAAADTAWQVVAASKPGVNHRKGHNEDAWLACSRLDRSLILAIADGAGSARYASAASRLAVARARNLLATGPLPSEEPWHERLLTLLREVRSTLLWEAERGNGQAHDYATTLLLTVVTTGELATLQLGDGAVVVRHRDGLLERPLQPARGRHAGETVFVTSDGAMDAARTAVLPARELVGVALLTDGLEPVATSVATGAPHHPFFNPLFTFAGGDAPVRRSRELGAFLDTPDLNERTQDDKTLILAVRS